MKKLAAFVMSVVACLSLAAVPALAFDGGGGNPGAEALNNLNATNLGGQSGQDAATALPLMVGSIIRTVLGLLGIVILVLIVYAGFTWMTARGNEKQVETAKSILSNAIIGAVIIFAAYAITGFVVNAIVNATTAQ